MKSFLLVLSVVAAAGALEPTRHYHDAVGAPLAARVLAFERSLPTTRIVGGVEAVVGAHPYLGGLLITLMDGRTSICGSSMLSHSKGVTAAQCWWDGRSQARQFVVVYGSDRLLVGGTRVTTTDVQLHESFNPITYANDIAIITHARVEYTQYIRPVLIATGSQTYADTWAVAVGYGRSTNELMGSESMYKRQVTLHVMTNVNCRLTWSTSVILVSTLCTSSVGGMSVCSGDTGGPLVIGPANGNRTLIGVVSFGADAGCSHGFPAAHTRVTSYTNWINNRI